MAKKKIDLMYCCRGNGMTVCNRAVKERGDYKMIAHISHRREVTFYAKRLPEDVKRKIITCAKTDDSSASVNQPWMKVFSTPRAKFNVDDKVIYTNGNNVEIGIRTIIGVDSVSYSGSGYGYYLDQSDTPWYAVPEENLKLV